ncbi:MAG: mannosyl-3-phosphoglycerate synthase [Candidatus Thermoplasmatota archaeon]|nr:mannosyl-3-phosphoglycerate synthase [Candidatus Thermoplasmatota archaeon]
MRIEYPRYTERFGSVRINTLQKILELDAGKAKEQLRRDVDSYLTDAEELEAIQKKLAIVVPIKNEKIKLFEGILKAIPHDCLLIIISNSRRAGIDRFLIEKDVLNQFYHFTHRKAVIIHQKDQYLAEAFKKGGYHEILDDNGLVCDGKAEGMIVGIILAKLFQKDYVGFIDADNYIPGAAWEYVKDFALGFSVAKSPYTMIRLSWLYKPKVTGMPGGLFFKKWGRVSESSNRCINSLISDSTGFGTDIVKTTCAGEHAMTMKLAEIIPYSTGYAIETGELLFIFENFGGILPTDYPTVIKRGVDIFQIETVNPHFHEDKGGVHLNDVYKSSLGLIYHSPLCGNKTRKLIRNILKGHSVLTNNEKIPKPRRYPPIKKIKFRAFSQAITPHLNDLAMGLPSDNLSTS